MLPEKIIFIGVFITFVGSLLYIKNIVYGNTRPNLVSWFIWMLAPFVGTFLQIKAGAGLASLAPFMAGFGPLLVIIVSLIKRNAIWKINTFDIICGLIALFSLILYVLTHRLGISILFAILSDLIAYFPTFIKSYKHPETESSFIYLGGIINSIFALLIIKSWIFAIYSFPIYLISANIVEVSFLYRQKIFKTKTPS